MLMVKRQVIARGKVSSCYFRTSVEPPYRKALVQITERCNLHCAHCFIAAGDHGGTMTLMDIRKVLIPQLQRCRVVSVSLTGGEPCVHPDVIEIISLFRAVGMRVGVCINATCIEESQIEALAVFGDVHCNVSLDGFSPESHGRFRGDEESFVKTVTTVRTLGRSRLLQGLLVTPINLAEVSEYSNLCEFAVENGAAYVLMNPLSSM